MYSNNVFNINKNRKKNLSEKKQEKKINSLTKWREKKECSQRSHLAKKIMKQL